MAVLQHSTNTIQCNSHIVLMGTSSPITRKLWHLNIPTRMATTSPANASSSHTSAHNKSIFNPNPFCPLCTNHLHQRCWSHFCQFISLRCLVREYNIIVLDIVDRKRPPREPRNLVTNQSHAVEIPKEAKVALLKKAKPEDFATETIILV